MALINELDTNPVLLNIQHDTAYEISFSKPFTFGINTIEFVADTNDEKKIRHAISYSFDNVNWAPYDPGMIDTPAFIEMHRQTSGLNEYWIKLKIITDFKDPADYYRLFGIKINDHPANPLGMKFTEISTYRGITTAHTKNLFRPYDHLDSSIDRMLAQMNKINEIFGHEVYFIKVKEVEDSFNATFKTYAKFIADSVKKMKVLVPNNDFKANTLVYAEFNIDYEESLEIHVVIEEFQRAFGIGSNPQTKDIVYVPQIGRIYDITASNAELQLGNTPGYYICKLKKHVANTDVHSDNIFNPDGFDINRALDFNINDFESSVTDFHEVGPEEIILEPNDSPLLAIDDDNAQRTGKIISDANVEGLQAKSLQDYYYLAKHDQSRLYVHKDLTVKNSPLKINSSPIFFRYYDSEGIKGDANTIQYTRVKLVSKPTVYNLSMWFRSIADNHKMISFYNILVSRVGNFITVTDTVSGEVISKIEYTNDDLWHFVSLNINVETMMINFSLFCYDHVDVEFKLIREEWCKSSLIKINKYIDKVFTYNGMLFSNIKLYGKSIENDNLINLAVDRTFSIEQSILIDTVFDIKRPKEDE